MNWINKILNKTYYAKKGIIKGIATEDFKAGDLVYHKDGKIYKSKIKL